MILSEEVKGANLGGYRHLLRLTVEEDFNADHWEIATILFVIERYKTLMFLFNLTFEDTSDCVDVSIEKISSLILLKKDTCWKRELICLVSGDTWEFEIILSFLMNFALSLNNRHLEHLTRCLNFIRSPCNLLVTRSHLILHLCNICFKNLFAWYAQRKR